MKTTIKNLLAALLITQFIGLAASEKEPVKITVKLQEKIDCKTKEANANTGGYSSGGYIYTWIRRGKELVPKGKHIGGCKELREMALTNGWEMEEETAK
jgi:hypothetical protein